MFNMKKSVREMIISRFDHKDKILKDKEDLIKKISDILFPPFDIKEIEGEKYSIDSSVDTNIDAVLTDLQDGYLDSICLQTLKSCFDKIYSVRKELNAFHEMDPAVNRCIIAMNDYKNDSIDNIESAEVYK